MSLGQISIVVGNTHVQRWQALRELAPTERKAFWNLTSTPSLDLTFLAIMRGEIANFSESLRRRVALLNGISKSVLKAVYREWLQPNPRVTELLGVANAAGLYTILVSDCFTFFTQRVQHDLGFTETHANTLEIQDGKLTDVALGDIVDASGKAIHIKNACEALAAQRLQPLLIVMALIIYWWWTDQA